jgi:hypothetical protein
VDCAIGAEGPDHLAAGFKVCRAGLNHENLARVSVRVRAVSRGDADEGAVGDSAEELRAQAGRLAGIFVGGAVLEHGLELLVGDECGGIGGNGRASLTAALTLALSKRGRGKT